MKCGHHFDSQCVLIFEQHLKQACTFLFLIISLEAMIHENYKGLVIYQFQKSIVRVIQIEQGIVHPGINLGSEACRKELVNDQLDLCIVYSSLGGHHDNESVHIANSCRRT